MINKQFTLAGRPVGRPIEDSDFEYKELKLENLMRMKFFSKIL